MTQTILVIDDSAVQRQVVGGMLKEAGYDVIEGTDGMNALSKLHGQKIHLVVCDLEMPVMDGITFVQALKHLPDYRSTPVLMVTNEPQEESKRAVRAVGAKAWAVKPFRPDALIGAVQRLALP